MRRDITATLPGIEHYDNCLIASCLRKLFKKTAKNNSEPVLVVHTNIADVKAELEKVNNGKLTELSYAYLAAMQQSVHGADFRYAIIYQNKVPVLFTYFQLYTLTSQNFSLENSKGFVKGILRFFLDLKKIKVLISGNALRNESLCCCYDDTLLNDTDTAEIIAAAAEKIAGDDGAAAVILKDMPMSGHVKKWLNSIGYQMPWDDNVMVMSIDAAWHSLADYIAALSRKYKTRANKILAAGKGISVRALSESEIKDKRDAINRLFKNVAQNQSFVLSSPHYDHFALLKHIYKDDFEVFGYFHEDQLVAFSSAFITRDAYELYYVGFDYQHNSEYQLYFNILFAGLERAIMLGKSLLKLGRTSFDAKASLGAKPVVIGYLIKMVNIPAVVSKWFINYFSAMEDAKWKLRNPLKQGSNT